MIFITRVSETFILNKISARFFMYNASRNSPQSNSTVKSSDRNLREKYAQSYLPKPKWFYSQKNFTFDAIAPLLINIFEKTDHTFVATGLLKLPYKLHYSTINTLGGDRFGAEDLKNEVFWPWRGP